MMEIQLQMLSSIAWFVFAASLKATVLLALVLLAQRMFSRFLTAHGRYLLWWAVVISLVTPIGFDLHLPDLVPVTKLVQAETTLPRVHQQLPPDRMPNQSPALVDTTDTGLGVANPVPWRNLLSLFWLAGVIVVLVTMIIASSRFFVMLRQASPAQAPLRSMLQHCREKVSCRTDVRLLVSDRIQTPLLTGLLRPVLLWPEGLEKQLTNAQLQHVFLHELMHLKRLDIYSACLVALIQALHWFNPAIWIACSRMRQDRELACDAATLRQLGTAEGQAYAQTLIHLGTSLPRTATFQPGLGILEDHKHLHQRILMLMQANPARRLQSALATVLFLAIAILAFSQPVQDTQRESVAEPVAESAPTPPVSEQSVADIVVIPAEAAATEIAPTVSVPATEELAVLAVAQASSRSPIPEFPATPVVEPEATTPVAATPLVVTETAEVDISAESVPEVPQQESTVMTTAEPICLKINLGDDKAQLICDNLEKWSVFEQHFDMEPGTVATVAATADPDQEFMVDQKVCRIQKSLDGIKQNFCRSTREWTVFDQLQRQTINSNAFFGYSSPEFASRRSSGL